MPTIGPLGGIVGSNGVVDRVNTTSGEARGVIAYSGIAGAGVVSGGGIIPPPDYITTEAGDRLDNEAGSSSIITEN
jgi:hypothetical protein